MEKEFELKFKKINNNLSVEVTNFKNLKQIEEFIKCLKEDWS